MSSAGLHPSAPPRGRQDRPGGQTALLVARWIEPVGSARARHAATALLAAVWFGGVFFAALPTSLLWLTGEGWQLRSGAWELAGALLAGASQLVVLLSVIAFVREGRGSHAPFAPPRVFVSGGFYRWLRNPMYGAYALTIAGEALIVGSWAVGAYSLTFAALAHVYVVGVEEKGLRERFGVAYVRYCDRVPRWIPRVPRSVG